MKLDLYSSEVSTDINVSFVDNLYEEIISSLLGKEVLNDKGSFLKFIIESIENNTEYSQYKKALEEVKNFVGLSDDEFKQVLDTEYAKYEKNIRMQIKIICKNCIDKKTKKVYHIYALKIFFLNLKMDILHIRMMFLILHYLHLLLNMHYHFQHLHLFL